MRVIRWCLILVAVVLPAVAASATSAERHTRRVDPLAPECTIVGTDGHDNLRGTSGDDVICALGGATR